MARTIDSKDFRDDSGKCRINNLLVAAASWHRKAVSLPRWPCFWVPGAMANLPKMHLLRCDNYLWVGQTLKLLEFCLNLFKYQCVAIQASEFSLLMESVYRGIFTDAHACSEMKSIFDRRKMQEFSLFTIQALGLTVEPFHVGLNAFFWALAEFVFRLGWNLHGLARNALY